MNKQNKLLFIIIISALIIRLISINQSLWLDEAIQANVSINYSLKEIFTKFLPTDFNPPLFYLITYFFVKILGQSEMVLRLPSVLAGVGLVYLVWRFLHILFKDKNYFEIKLLTIALFISSPLLIYYSQEARGYMLASFLVFWSMLEFYQNFIEIKEKKSNLFKYFIATFLMFISHYLTWFIWPVQVLLLYFYKPKKEFVINFKKMLTPLSAALILLPLIISQIKQGITISQNLPMWQSLSVFSLRQLLLIPAKIITGKIAIDFNLPTFIFLSILMLIWSIYVFYGLIKKEKNKLSVNLEKYTDKIFFLSWLIIPVILGSLLSIKLAIFTYFRFLYIIPAFYLVLAVSLKNLKKEKAEIILFIFLLVNCVFSSLYLFNKTNHREDWRFMAKYISNQNLSQNVIIVGDVSSPYRYYDRNQHEIIDYKQIEQIRFAKSLWLVKYAQPIFDSQNQTEEILINSYGFVEVSQKNFTGDLSLKYLVNPKILQKNKL